VAYVLHGVIGTAEVLQPCRAFAHAVVIPLGHGLYLLPMTGDLIEEVRRGDPVDPRLMPCERFPPGFDRTLADWSQAGPVAYVEAEYFGGTGSQLAAVWQAGQLVLGPIIKAEDAPPSAAGKSPISQALRCLGVSAGGHFDEFDAVGLGRHRDTDGWFDEES